MRKFKLNTTFFIISLCGCVWSTSSRADFSVVPMSIGELKEYQIKGSETLLDVARNNNLGYMEMIMANPSVDVWVPQKGDKVILPTWHILPDIASEDKNGIVANLGDMRLYYYTSAAETPKSFAIGIYREDLKTPQGKTNVVRKAEKPTWYPTPEAKKRKPELPDFVPPGDDNPLGIYAMYLGWPAFLIHGTNKPYSVGRRGSAGCIRMYPEGVEKLFKMVKVGDSVYVINQGEKIAMINKELYFEAHPTLTQVDAIENEIPVPLELGNYVLNDISLKSGDQFNRIDWTKVREIVHSRPSYPLKITK